MVQERDSSDSFMKIDNSGSEANGRLFERGMHRLPVGIDKRRPEVEGAHAKHRVMEETSDRFVYN